MLARVEQRIAIALLAAVLLMPVGCGTTKWTDTRRTATEQLLLSSAIDEAVNRIDFSPLSGKDAYLDASYLDGTIDRDYVVACLLERLRSQGCTVKDRPSDAKYIVEARAGAVGTNRQEALIGIPGTQFSMPVGSQMGKAVQVPEIALAKRTTQTGVAKIACFAYERATGQAFWQSGTAPITVRDKETFVAGVSSLKNAVARALRRRAKTKPAFTP